MKTLSEFLNESIIDPDRQIHSVAIFDLGETVVLKSSVRNQILSGIAKLTKFMIVKDYTLIGSILTTHYAEDADVDINVLISADDDEMSDFVKLATQHSGKFVEGTTHPINFHLLNDDIDFKKANDSADGVFDITKNKFIREPKQTPFYIHTYMKKFKQIVSNIEHLKGEMQQDLMDYKELRHLSREQASKLADELQHELTKIESSAVGLVDLYNKVRSDRLDAFARELTVKDIQAYGEKNRLPESVLYKLLERYHYLSFLHKVKEILGDDRTLSSSEADRLLDVLSH